MESVSVCREGILPLFQSNYLCLFFFFNMLNCLKQNFYVYGNSPPDWHPQPFMTQSSPTPGNDALSTDGRGTRFILLYVGPEGTFRDRRTRARSCSHKSEIEIKNLNIVWLDHLCILIQQWSLFLEHRCFWCLLFILFYATHIKEDDDKGAVFCTGVGLGDGKGL